MSASERAAEYDESRRIKDDAKAKEHIRRLLMSAAKHFAEDAPNEVQSIIFNWSFGQWRGVLVGGAVGGCGVTIATAHEEDTEAMCEYIDDRNSLVALRSTLDVVLAERHREYDERPTNVPSHAERATKKRGA